MWAGSAAAPLPEVLLTDEAGNILTDEDGNSLAPDP
jgi:hypothetical protein